MRRQADLLATLVNLAAPGRSQGSPYTPPPAGEVMALFTAELSGHHATALRAVPHAAAGLTDLAADFREVFTAPDLAASVELLNALIARCHALPYLTRDTGQPYHLHFHGAGDAVAALGGELATGLALVVDSLGEDRFGLCQAHACDRVYIDLTRNGSRRFCSTGCSSRAKTAAYRARRA
ncbi:CGNR zinc finger domain-containing protein [Streptomyces bacillaris]|uniref:CGNR zinc finger domain-containing protein n=1 Tax=Streptomyces bacillaris TaxID=68179 RepID=UPI003460D1FF